MNLIPYLPFIQLPAEFSCIDDVLSIGFGEVMIARKIFLCTKEKVIVFLVIQYSI